MTAALGLLAALFTLAPVAHAAAVPQELTDAATADPAASFDVHRRQLERTGTAYRPRPPCSTSIPTAGESITRHFAVIDGVTAHLSGAQVLALADDARVDLDHPGRRDPPDGRDYTNAQPGRAPPS